MFFFATDILRARTIFSDFLKLLAVTLSERHRRPNRRECDWDVSGKCGSSYEKKKRILRLSPHLQPYQLRVKESVVVFYGTGTTQGNHEFARPIVLAKWKSARLRFE